MKAVVVAARGSPDGLCVVERPEPEPGPDEVVIAVHTVAANHPDINVILGQGIGRRTELPHIPGIDPAGVVVAVGDQVDHLRLADRVVVKPTVFCGDCRFCRAGEDDSCECMTFFGAHRDGGFAERAVAPARTVYPIPDTLGFAAATALAHSVPVAMQVLREHAAVAPDDTVLVLGAAGAVGAACVQIAKLLGARVIAGAGSAERAAYAASLGADDVFDYGARPDFADLVRELAGPRGITVYVELASDVRLWEQVVPTLGRKARVVVVGAHAGPQLPIDMKWLYLNRTILIGSGGSTERVFRDVLDLAGRSLVTPSIHGILPVSAYRDGFWSLMRRTNRGKVVFDVAGWDAEPEAEGTCA